MSVLICTICASPDVIAVRPGSDGDDFGDLFAVERPVADLAWCLACWPCRPVDAPLFAAALA